MVRLISALVVVGIAVGLGILAWPQLFGVARAPIAAHVVSLRGLAVVVGGILVVVFTLLALIAPAVRRFSASIALVILVFCGVNGVVLAARGLGDIAFDTASDSDVTVLAWNTLGDAPGASVISALAIETGSDIVSLPETTYEMGLEVAAIMEASGMPVSVHTLAYDQVAKARSTTLIVSESLGEYQFEDGVRTTSVLPSVVATPVDGSGPTIVAVHALAPLPPMMLEWQRDLEWVANACAGENVILAGDFNATLDHLSGVAGSDGATLGRCADAALASDNAAVGTWPAALPPLLGAPIDHVMATPNWRVSGMRVVQSHDGYGSDHRPVLVQLTPSG